MEDNVFLYDIQYTYVHVAMLSLLKCSTLYTYCIDRVCRYNIIRIRLRILLLSVRIFVYCRSILP